MALQSSDCGSVNERMFNNPFVSPEITRRRLPHWTKPGSVFWVTFRLADSLPHSVLQEWQEARELWMSHHPVPWSDEEWREYSEKFGDRLDKWLDRGMGSCVLAQQKVRDVVCACLMRFDGERLNVHGAVIMPNHVHVLLEPLQGYTLAKLMGGIKGASAREANRLIGGSGRFWFGESYDHIVRSREQYNHFMSYIELNPVKAKLPAGKYWLYLPGRM